MGEYFLSLYNCQLNSTGPNPRVETVSEASTSTLKTLFKLIPKPIRLPLYLLREGLPLFYPAKINVGLQDINAIFEVHSLMENTRLKNLGYERDYLAKCLSILTSQDVFYDIGAYVGSWSILAAKQQPSCQIYSFEPEPNCYEKVNRNVKLNKLTKQICVLPLAISNCKGRSELFSSGVAGKCASLKNTNRHLKRLRVDTYSVDELVEDEIIPQPTVVKIDAEGAEALILEGMKRHQPRNLFIEIHPEFLVKHFDSSPQKVWETLISQGYIPQAVWLRTDSFLCHFSRA